MPHAIIEYSSTVTRYISAVQLVTIVHEKMIACGLFTTPDIKSRAYPAEDFAVGESGSEGSFVHVTIALLTGRPVEKRQELSQSVLNALADALPNVDQLTVDIQEMMRETFSKRAKT